MINNCLLYTSDAADDMQYAMFDDGSTIETKK